MDRQTKNHDISTLIIRFIKGELSEQEAETLLRWRNEDERHDALFRKLTTRYAQEDYDRFRDVSRLDGWPAMAAKMRKSGKRRNLTFKKFAAAVAVVAGIALGSYFIIDNLRPESDTEIAGQIQDIHPGITKATLILASGEQIDIDGNTPSDMEILSEHGVFKEGNDLVVDGGTEIAVETHTWTVPRGGEFFITLSDGTSVWLNSESKLVYPSHFKSDERRVSVEGEAYFSVAKDEKQPFVVDVGGLEINVTGTEFNVAAYDDVVETTLINGSVNVLADGETLSLTPGWQAVYAKDGALAAREVDTSVYTAWKDGVFEFRDLELSEIARRLSRWYDVDFSFDHPEVGNIRFTGAFKRSSSISVILDVINTTKSVDYRFDGDAIILQRK